MEEKLKSIVEKLDKFKLLDIISSIYYYYKCTDDYNNMISTSELEYIIDFIYKTKNTQKNQPTKDDVILIIQLTNLIITQNFKKLVQNNEDIIFTQAKDDFLYEKEDTEYDSIVFEYLNLFNVIGYFFETYYSFKIENFLRFTGLIQIEYVDRMKLIEQFLKRSNKNITHEILIEYLLNCNILNFNEKTLARNNEELVDFKNILKKFSTDDELCIKKEFKNYPIFKQEDTYIFSSIFTLLNNAKHIFEKEIRRDKILANFYAYKKGEYLEILTQNVIQDILKDAKLFPNIQYPDGECDLLAIFDQIILIIEIKGRAFKEVSKEGLKDYLEQDLNDNIYKAYSQASRMEKYLTQNKDVSLRFSNGKHKQKLKLENTDKFKIFKIGITLENFRKYAIQYKEFNNNVGHDMLFFYINDLKFISKYFRYQTEFIHYISQRIKTNKYINKFYLYDELYLFSDYKIYNLQRILNNNHQAKIFDYGRYKLFDLRFDTEKKEQLLNGFIHPLFDEIIKQMERDKLPTYSLTILDLLDLDYKSQEYIFEQLKIARSKYKETGEPISSCISVDEERDSKGMHLILSVLNKENMKDCLEANIVLGNMIKRKYPNSEVIAILNDIDDKEDKIIQCLKMMQPKENFGSALDKIEELKNLYDKI